MKKKIFIAGHKGMVGSSVLKYFKNKSNYRVVISEKKTLDLLNQSKVFNFLKHNKFDYVIICAALAGGIYDNNKRKADFIYQNLQIQNNLIYGSHLFNVKKLIFLGSSCIYPKFCKQPMKEEYLLSGYLEPTNEPYSIAKIAGINLCNSIKYQYKKDFRCIMPTNLYGENDKYDLNKSHVIPALIKKFHFAKVNNDDKVTVWGTGKVYRDFLYVDDLAKAIYKIFSLSKINYNNLIQNTTHVNVGSGKEISIKQLALTIKKITNYKGKIFFDHTKPDGMPKKMLDISRIKKIKWFPKTSLKSGLKKTYNLYKKPIKKKL